MIELENNTNLEIDISNLENIANTLTKKDIELVVVNNEEMRLLNKEHKFIKNR